MSDPAKVSLVEVIHVSFDRGTGVANDPVRPVNQYWSKDGRLLAEFDHIHHAPDAPTHPTPEKEASHA